MRIARIIVSAFLLLAGLPLLAEQAHPNFTGIWKLDTHRSTLNTQPPESITLYIHQNDPDFHLRSTEVRHGKSLAWSVHGRTDGKTLATKNREGVRVTHMYWQGSELVLEVKHDDRRGEKDAVYRYSLSDDGRTLVAREIRNDQDNRWVFTKKNG